MNALPAWAQQIADEDCWRGDPVPLLAAHEAGHAAALCLLHLRVCSVSTQVEKQGIYTSARGTTVYSHHDPVPLDDELVILAAGQVGTLLHLGDHPEAQRFARATAGHDHEAAGRLATAGQWQWAQVRCAELLAPYRDVVLSLAQALVDAELRLEGRPLGKRLQRIAMQQLASWLPHLQSAGRADAY